MVCDGLCYVVVLVWSFSVIPIFQTFKGDENCVQKLGSLRNWGVKLCTVFDWGKGNNFWFEFSGGSKNRHHHDIFITEIFIINAASC